MKNKETWALIQFAATGTIELVSSEPGVGHCHISGSPSNPEWFLKKSHWWADPPDEWHHEWDNYKVPSAGVPVLDKRAALETPEGRAWVFDGPMVNAKLIEGTIDRLPQVSPLMAPVVAAYGMAGSLLKTMQAAKTPQAGPLDMVSISEYVRGWVDHGARLGRFFVNADGSGRIEWADGEVQHTQQEALVQA